MSELGGNGSLTSFPRLPTDIVEERQIEAQNQGVFSSFFGRLFRSSAPPSSSALDVIPHPPVLGCSTALRESPPPEALHRTDSGTSNEASGSDTPGSLRKFSIESLSAADQRKFSNRLTSLFRSSNRAKLEDYNQSAFKRYWMPDSTGKECYECQEKFTAFRRRHHCRLCGQIFCSKCSSAQVPGALLGYMGDLRLCSYCARIVESYLTNQKDEAEFRCDVDPIIPSNPLAAAGTESPRDVPLPESDRDDLKGIATVSAGSLMWSGDDPLNHRRPSVVVEQASSSDLISLGSNSTISGHPTMLCVQQLALQNREFTHASSDVVLGAPSSRRNSEEYEFEPDWVKRIDMAQASSRMEGFKPAETFAYELAPSMPISNVPSTSDLSQSGIQFEAPPTISSDGAVDSLSSAEEGDDTFLLFEHRLDRVLSVLFNREQLDSEVWRPVIWSLSKQIAQTVRVDVASRNDNMNILSYVHVKKFVVKEETPSTRVIHGVVCSKAIAHSQMPSDIENASVLTLAGSIEYERVGGKLSTLLPIITQEKDYLAKQIDRMMSRRPSVVVVENTVANLAVDMLLAEGVCLVSNIRSKVINRIARVTNADVLPSLDAQLLQQRIGFAPRFRQERFLLKDGSYKTILVFDECNADLGCSVLLFANSMRELRAAKRILKFMVSLWYSAKLEIAFLDMFETKLVAQSRSWHPDCLACRFNRDNVEQTDEEESFTSALANTELGNSPFIRVGAPFLATSRGQKCNLRQYFKQQNLYRYAHSDEFVNLKAQLSREEKENEDANARVREQKEEIDQNMKHPFLTDQKIMELDEDRVSLFRAQDGLVFRSRHEKKTSRFGKAAYYSDWSSGNSPCASQSFLSESAALKDDALSPFEHQRIAVLFGSYSAKSVNAPFFCVKPWVVRMDFYSKDDMCLGVFLHKFCLNEAYKCNSCNLSMLDHQRKIVYGRVRIEIITQTYVQQASEEFGGTENGASAFSQQSGILGWRYCPSCKASSTVTPLSNEVWHLSFAKYVDYLANGMYSTSAISAHTRNGFCRHCTFHEQHHFFAHNSYVTTFKVTPVQPYHIFFSPIQCIVEPKTFSRQAIVVNRDEMVRMGRAIFDQMQLYLERFESHPEASKHITFHTLLSTLLLETRQTFEDRLSKFDPINALSATTTIRSNDAVHINATEAVTWCRHYVFRLIEKWNEQSVRLAAAIKVLKKSASTTTIESSNPSNASLDSTAASLAGLTPDPEIPTLESPFASDLHLSLPWRSTGVPVIVRDLKDTKGNTQPDIGSIIAYALASPMYEEKKRKMRETCGEDSIPISLKISASAGNFGKEVAGTGTTGPDANLGSYQHLEVDFEDANAQYYVKAYYAEQFQMLRKVLFTEGEDQFIRSLSQSLNWKPEGGKSGASFFKTRDERFVFKQMSRFEIQSFVKFAPNYFDYIYTAVSEKKLTMLCKVYGVYRVAYTKKQTNQETKMDVLVMEYLFYRRKIKQTWDLKGSLRNRWASSAKTGTPVLLDENLVKDFWNNQLYVHPHSKAALNQAISNDSHFLSSQHVMDYSLLAGIDEENDEVILGIVDYMRTYTLDKKLESWVKIVAIPGGQLPTVLSPEMYCTRFSDAIDTYFPIAPDQWTGIGTGINY